MKPIYLYLDEAVQNGAAENDSDIGRKIGATRSAVSSWRSGRRAPDDDQAVKLAELLGKDSGEILAECAAARAKNPETRKAWERIAAKMAASSITVCTLIFVQGVAQEAKAAEINKLLFSELRRRFVIKLLAILAPVMTECIG